ncbi:MAG: cyclic nucleotide-binding/CBS domain-containing protein [Chloroflexota bacterium]
MKKLRELMTSPVITIGAHQDIHVAAGRMREWNIGSLVVVTSQDEVDGIITPWDLAIGCMGAGHDPRECLVYHHMSSPAHTARPDTDTLEAAHIMAERRITRLPIVEHGKLVGIVTFSNLSRAMNRLMQDLLTGWEPPVG